MGFSVSGATAVVFVGLLVSAGILYPSIDRYTERRSEAIDARNEDALLRQNTALGSVNATYDASATELVVTVNNTGADSLALPAVDLLVDGGYRTLSAGATTVDGNSGTDVWAPGETLRITMSESTTPNRVKLVTGPGVATTATVEVV
jgi:flagellar protein FlaF